MIKKMLLVANWKMNPPSIKEALELVNGYEKFKSLNDVSLIVAIPYIYLADISRLKLKNVILSSQNLFYESREPHTGEVSSLMLASLGVKYSIIGHSERRKLGESSSLISKKVKEALKNNILPILCVGEEIRDESGEYMHFLENQIGESLKGINKKEIEKVTIAYEPIWAINKNEENAMGPSDIHTMVIFIRKVLGKLFGIEMAKKVKIIYGGSVGPTNAKVILENGETDGFLVGHQSLSLKNFEGIYKLM